MGKLIRLELFNFKSYKGHHVLLFGDSYFTSIIGPNGSGKSNSMDAISFVLGIKSSFLRSTHLRDLVYRGRVLKSSKIDANGDAVEQAAGGDDEPATPRGSQRNDPTSAWVMAVYEDDAGEEHKWRRSVTSAGQSEYRINNKVVGAKQYNEALEHEQILIKARNFLVFQGDIEAIANQDDKDLSKLVEQISGSLDYKAEYEQKEEEARVATEDHIEKTNQRKVINGEIKRYSEEKKEFDSFKRKEDARDDAVMNHILWKLYHFEQVIETSNAEIERFQDELKEYRRGVEKHEKALDDAKKQQTKVSRDVAGIDRDIKRKSKSAEETRNELDPIDEKLKLSRANQAKFKERIAKISKERDAQSKTVDQLVKDMSTVQKAQSKWEQEWKQQTTQQGRQLNEADFQEYNRLRSEVSKRAADAQLRLSTLTRQRKTDEETVLSFKTRTEECESRIVKFQEALDELKQRKRDVKAIVDETSKGVDAKKKEYNRMTSDRLKAEQQRTELDEKLQQVLIKLLEADDGRRQTEKELRAKETLLAMKRLFPGVRGRVHELCKPKQKKYDTAVSTVLGRHFDSIVVDNEKTAKECIEYLRAQRAGVATFLPLDTIQVKNVNSSLKNIHQKARLAIDIIEYESAVERAMSTACGNALVCDDMATAKHLSYERKVDAKAVTLDGTVIHKAGLMTGGKGPNDKQRQKTWDDTQVDSLRRMKDKYMSEIQALPNAQETVVREEALQAELFGLQQQLASAQDEIKALEKNVESKKKELQHAKDQLAEVKPKYEEQSSHFETLQQRITKVQSEVSRVEDEVFAAFCRRLNYDNIRSYEAQQGSMQQEASQKKLEFNQQRTKLESQLTFNNQRLQTTQDRIKNLEKSDDRDGTLVADLENHKEDLQGRLDQYQEELELLQERLAEVKKSLDEKASQVADARRELGKRSRDIESTTKTLTGLEAEVQRNRSGRFALLRKCKIDSVDLPLTDDSKPLDSLPIQEALDAEVGADAMDVDEDVQDAADQDYGIEIDYSDLADDLKENSTSAQDDELQKAIASLNTELSSLTPNMRAIDRLNAAQEKLSALEGPYTEARRLAKSTNDAFEEIRAKRADLFNKAFDHISEQILPTYKKLTQTEKVPLGGSAWLTKQGNDAKPFEGGVNYRATPPGKRFRDIAVLSGGEKSIAALALLFAVHSFAPSPFFVLDEVDAALDNANVAQVARYITQHKGPGTQFVVISLKLGLFQESDTLVGVMRDQSANSSRPITLDLRKYQPS